MFGHVIECRLLVSKFLLLCELQFFTLDVFHYLLFAIYGTFGKAFTSAALDSCKVQFLFYFIFRVADERPRSGLDSGPLIGPPFHVGLLVCIYLLVNFFLKKQHDTVNFSPALIYARSWGASFEVVCLHICKYCTCNICK